MRIAHQLSLIFFHIFALTTPLWAQESASKVMEARAREMHRVMGVDDKIQWEKYVQDNYSAELIAKPMRAQVSTSADGQPTASTEVSANSLKEKALLFQQLHNDFAKSKIVSLTPSGENVDMVIQNDEGMKGSFKLKFEKEPPYKIDGLSINVN